MISPPTVICRFADKVVVISGASRGIGAAMAVAFAREGASLILGYQNESDERAATNARINEAGGRAVWVQGDIAQESVSKELCAKALIIGGRIDVVIANAGISHFAPFVLASDNDLQTLIGVNQLGVYFLLRSAARTMKKQGKGVVLVLSSTSATQVPKMNALYAGTKAFVEALTKGFAAEYAAFGIRANVISPSATETEMSRVKTNVSPSRLTAMNSFGRLARPEEVAAVALFLCSDEASYINGQTIPVTGVTQG